MTGEGGGPSASESRLGRKGASPFPADILRPVAEGQGVAATRGRSPPEANGSAVGGQETNAIRLGTMTSRLGKGEVRTVGREPGGSFTS